MSSPTNTPPAPLPDTAPAASHRRWVKALVVVLVLAGALTAVQLTPLRAWLKNTDQLRSVIHDAGLWAYPLVVLAVAAMVSCGVPRLLLCGVGALVLGFWTGLLLVCAGTLIGYYGVFLFVRWGGREWVLHRWPRLREWSASFSQNQGVLTVILIRQIPIHGTITNLCFGLSHVKHRHFLIGTGIGLFPEAIPAALVGTSFQQGTLKESLHYLVLAVVAIVILGFICRKGLRAIRARRPEIKVPVADE